MAYATRIGYVEKISECGTIFSTKAPVEAMRVDVGTGASGGSMKQTSLIVSSLVCSVHLLLFHLVLSPQSWVLDTLNL